MLREIWLIIAALIVSIPAADGAETAHRGKYNVLMVSIDSLRADHCGSYGYERPTTPNLDRFAGDGALFEEVTAASSWTIPSHMSLFTSLYPSVHGVEGSSSCLGNGVTTLAEVLKNQGYATAAFVTGPALNHVMGFSRGFDTYDDFSASLMSGTDIIQGENSEETGLNQLPTNHVITNMAGNWLRQHANQQFFLFVHYWDCHFDYTPPPPYDTKFDHEYRGRENGRDIVKRQAHLERKASPEDRKHLVALYDGEIAHTDAHLGKLLQALADSKLAENTMVVVLSDHGEGFWEHGKTRHGYGLQEELVHVPLVMRLPGVIPAGCRIAGNASHVDVMPTLLGILKISGPAISQGMDLSVAFNDGQRLPERPIFSELNKHENQMRSVRWGPYKISQTKGEDAGPLMSIRNGKEVEASDLEADALAQLRQEMSAALESGPSTSTSPDRLAKPAEPDEKTLGLLRSLGYIQ